MVGNESKKEADVRKLLGDQESRINDTYAEMLANYEADDDNDMLKQVMGPYSQEESMLKRSKARIRESMKKVLGQGNQANFNHKTWDVLK